MSKERENLFEKAARDRKVEISDERRQAIADANMDVADRILATKVENKMDDKAVTLIETINEQKRTKKQYSYYVYIKINDFIGEFCDLTGISKSEFVNQMLTYSILNHIDIQQLAREKDEIRALYKDFVEFTEQN